MKNSIPDRNRVIVLLLFVIAAFSATSIAQDSFGRITGKGLKLGLSFATLKGDDVDPHLVSQVGIAAGGFVTFHLSGILSLQPEILFTQKRSKLDFKTETGYGIYHYNFAYLNLPILLKVSIPLREDAVRPNIFAGPFLAAKIGSKIDYKTVNAGVETTGERNLENIRGLDAGLVFGGGVTVATKTGKLIFDVRYEMSLSSLSTEGDKVRHRALIFLFGYSFN